VLVLAVLRYAILLRDPTFALRGQAAAAFAIGHFANASHAFAKALILGGVTRRFPELRSAFLYVEKMDGLLGCLSLVEPFKRVEEMTERAYREQIDDFGAARFASADELRRHFAERSTSAARPPTSRPRGPSTATATTGSARSSAPTWATSTWST